MVWLEIEVQRQDQAVLLRGRGSRGESLAPQPLADVDLGRLTGFTNGVRRAITGGQALPEHVLAEAQALHAAVFSGPLGELVARLVGLALEPVRRRVQERREGHRRPDVGEQAAHQQSSAQRKPAKICRRCG